MPLIPEKLASRQDVKSAIACQFWEQPSHSARSIDGLVWSLPCEPPALNLTGSSGLSRTQQLLAAQALGVPAFPSYDAHSDGLVFDRVLGKLGGKRWWTAIGARVKAQRMWREAAWREGSDKMNTLRDLENYGLVARGRYQLGRRLTLNGIVESPSITLLSRRAHRRAVAAAEVVSRWVRPQQRRQRQRQRQQQGPEPRATAGGTEGTNGLEASPSSPAAAALSSPAVAAAVAVPDAPESPRSPSHHASQSPAEQEQEEFRAHASLKYVLPGHDLTATLGCQQDYVDSNGEYAHVPLAASLDLSSQYRADGLQYRVGLHQVTAPAIEGASKAAQRMRTMMHIQGAVAVEGEANIWKPSPPQPQPAAQHAAVAAAAGAAPAPTAAPPAGGVAAAAPPGTVVAQAQAKKQEQVEDDEGEEEGVGKNRLATALESGRQVDEGGDPLTLPPRRPRGERKRRKKGKRGDKDKGEDREGEGSRGPAGPSQAPPQAQAQAPEPEQRPEQEASEQQQQQQQQQQAEHRLHHQSHSHGHSHGHAHHSGQQKHHHHSRSHRHHHHQHDEGERAAPGASGTQGQGGHAEGREGPAAAGAAAPRQHAAVPVASGGGEARGGEGGAATANLSEGGKKHGEQEGAGGEGNLAELAGASLESFMRPLGELIHTVTHIHEGGSGPGGVAPSGGTALGQGTEGGDHGLPSPTLLLNISAKTIEEGIRETLHLLEQVKESVAALTSDVQDGSLQRLSQQLADSSGRREAAAAAPRRRPYSLFLSQPHLKINGSMGCLARMPLPPLRSLAAAVPDPLGTAPPLPRPVGQVQGAQGASSASLSSLATTSTQLADSWEPYLKGTSLRLFASAGISGQLGRFTRPFLDYTAASLRVDVGLTSPHVVGLLPDPASLDASDTHRPDKHRAFALEGRGSWHSLSASLAQQVLGPVRARADFRFALDPTNMPQNAGERSTIKGLVQTALSVRPSLLEAVFGFDVVLPGTEGAARLACWWSPHRKEAMAELRLF